MNPTDALPLFTSASDYGDVDELRIERWSQLKRDVLRLYGDLKPRIPDEAAHDLGRDYMSVRPRASFLRTEGLLRATGKRRKARTGYGHELKITERGLEVLRRLNAKSDAAA